MARKPDTPCSGCGKLLWGGRGCLPAGRRRCRDCRRADPPRPKPSRTATCKGCGADFLSTRSVNAGDRWRLTCSRACALSVMASAASKPTQRSCRDCGCTFVGTPLRKLCAPCRVLARKDENRRKNNKRRGLRPADSERPARLAYIAGRDGWRCHLCLGKVDRHLVCPDPLSPSIDHLVPISDGGSDDPENLRLAHFGCNSSRSAGGTVQLLLFG
jgi:hypothetical protein